jgi:hypothetical protein
MTVKITPVTVRQIAGFATKLGDLLHVCLLIQYVMAALGHLILGNVVYRSVLGSRLNAVLPNTEISFQRLLCLLARRSGTNALFL